jgi:hypothetical protein
MGSWLARIVEISQSEASEEAQSQAMAPNGRDRGGVTRQTNSHKFSRGPATAKQEHVDMFVARISPGLS